MKQLPVFFLLFLATNLTYSQQLGFQFLSPSPGSHFNHRETSISIRKGTKFSNKAPLSKSSVELTGSISGSHDFTLALSDDQRTLIIKPSTPFSFGETVTVRLDGEFKTETGDSTGPLQFNFTISPNEILSATSMPDNKVGPALLKNSENRMPLLRISKTNDNSIPASFPVISEFIDNVQPRWNFFLDNIVYDSNIVNTPYIMILNTAGVPLFYKTVQKQAHDFKWQPTGKMTYFDTYIGGFVVLDSSFQVIDTIFCGNGYSTNLHDIRMLPNGHTFLMSYDVQQVAMDTVVPSGDQYAHVTGLVIQELDQYKNVIFQWRSWDHFTITDAIGIDFLAKNIDAVHGNAIEIDSDTSIVISSRHLSEITKIDVRTGNIIWRWGGKNNQFTFINDSIGFSYQHAIRKIANGHYTLFDNGNFHSPQFSRAVEYVLDEKAKKATLVWSYRHTPDLFGSAMGYVQRLNDGSTLIGWGATNPSVTMVDANDSILMEMSLPDGVYSYRAYAYTSQSTASIYSADKFLPNSTTLFQNYPNPFNPATNITYQISEPGPVKLIVYDLLGREVTALVNDYETAGNHSIRFDASRLTSGTYFYRLTSGSNSVSKKMMLLK